MYYSVVRDPITQLATDVGRLFNQSISGYFFSAFYNFFQFFPDLLGSRQVPAVCVCVAL